MNSQTLLARGSDGRRSCRGSAGVWIAAVIALLVTPLLIMGAVAWSCLTLDRDARILRDAAMSAGDAAWATRVQVSVGSIPLQVVRVGLSCAAKPEFNDARRALASVERASVGVYERRVGARGQDSGLWMTEVEQTLRPRGWTRALAVRDAGNVVLGFTRDHGGDRTDVCLAVVDAEHLVIVSTRVGAEALAALVHEHIPELRAKTAHLRR